MKTKRARAGRDSPVAVSRTYGDANPATGAVVSGGAFKHAILQAGASSITADPTVAIAQVPAGARVWLAAKGGAGRIIAGSFDLVII